MKTTMALVALLLTSGSAHAGGLDFTDGVLRVRGGASGRGRSIWARGKTLVVVLPPKAIAPQRLKVGRAGVRHVRVLARRNRTDVELHLEGRAERLLGKLELRDEGKDLLVVVDRAAARAAAARRAAELAAVTANRAAKTAKAKLPHAGKTAAGSKRGSKQTPKSEKSAAWLAKQQVRKAKHTPSWLAGKTKKEPIGGNTRVWLIVGLLLVGGGVAFFLRRRRRQEGGARSEIDFVCSRALSGKQKLVVIEVESERLLLACSDKDVRLLHALGGSAQQQVAPAYQPELTEARRQTLEEIFGASAAPAEAAPAPESSPAPLGAGRFIDQLERQLARARAEPAFAAERQVTGRQVTGRQATERQATERQAAERQAAERQAAERQAAERQVTERQAAERAAIARTHEQSGEAQELDEKWAEGIRRLRRARSSGDNHSAGPSRYGRSDLGPSEYGPSEFGTSQLGGGLRGI